MDLNLGLTMEPAPITYRKAHHWSVLSVAMSLGLAAICIAILGMSSFSTQDVMGDVVRSISSEALVVGLCALSSLINAYATHQVALLLKI